jgi:hypothetical protein
MFRRAGPFVLRLSSHHPCPSFQFTRQCINLLIEALSLNNMKNQSYM